MPTAKLDLGDTTALLGAGISVDAGLPAAYDFVKELVEVLVRPAWAQAALLELTTFTRANKRDDFDVIRFETLIEWIEDVFDESLGFFELLDSYTEPGPLHLQFAHAAMNGTRLVTPNFDDLLELAVARSGGSAYTVDAHAAPRAVPGVPVLKLHGTRNVHRGSRVNRSRGGLQTTTVSIAASSPGNLLNSVAETALRNAVDGRTLVVAGYSASDDMDIVPTLAGCTPKNVVWVNYRPGRTSRARVPKDEFGWPPLVRRWQGAGIGVEVWQGLPVDIVAGLGIRSTVAATPGAHPWGHWRTVIRDWARKVRPEDPTGLGLAMLLFAHSGRYDLADRALQESRGVRRAGAGWSTARRAYELAQSTLLRVGSDPAEAARLAARASKEAARLGEPKFELFSVIVQGRAKFLQQDFAGAAAEFERVEAMATQPLHLAYGRLLHGKSLVWLGEYRAGKKLLRPALSTFVRMGELEMNLDARDALADADLGLGDLDSARSQLLEADRIAANLGFTDRRTTLGTSLGRVELTHGDLDEAAVRAHSAIEFAKAGNDEVAQSWILLARVEFERNRSAAALRAVECGLRTNTVITRDLTAELYALRAHLRYLLGNPRAARTAASAALAQPPTHRSAWGVLHALAVQHALGLPVSDELDHAVLAWKPRSVEQIVVDGAMLHRLSPGSPGAARLSASALRHATKLGAGHWVDVLSH